MKIAKATASYENWLGRHLRLVADDLALKHESMRSGAFPFFRATYYRWAQTWADICGDAARAPKVLTVGDLHVENFGTWRDSEGRLIWGVNGGPRRRRCRDGGLHRVPGSPRPPISPRGAQ
jgi:uncharacterized protein (DUF2252 family)